jgi:hypothetical protein
VIAQQPAIPEVREAKPQARPASPARKVYLLIEFVGLFIGVPLGLVSGYFGGKIDFGIQRATDAMLAFPGFLLALALVSVLGVGIKNTIISIGISMVPQYIRLVRACVLTVRAEDYVEAARAAGTRDGMILWRHILPNVMVPITVQTSLSMGTAILFAAGLGFLGIGVQPPTPEWGTMLGSARNYLFHARMLPRSRPRHLAGRPELQSSRRRAAGCPGSAVQRDDLAESSLCVALHPGHCGVPGVRLVTRDSRALNLNFGQGRPERRAIPGRADI